MANCPHCTAPLPDRGCPTCSCGASFHIRNGQIVEQFVDHQSWALLDRLATDLLLAARWYALYPLVK